MAKKSKLISQQRGSKFSTRNYTRCTRCGRPHGVLSKFGLCRICFRELALRDKFLVLKNQVGSIQELVKI